MTYPKSKEILDTKASADPEAEERLLTTDKDEKLTPEERELIMKQINSVNFAKELPSDRMSLLGDKELA